MQVIREKHLAERAWDNVVSGVEDAVLGGSLEDAPLEREQAWSEAGPKHKQLRKALEKAAKDAGMSQEKEMTIQTWREGLAGLDVD